MEDGRGVQSNLACCAQLPRVRHRMCGCNSRRSCCTDKPRSRHCGWPRHCVGSKPVQTCAMPIMMEARPRLRCTGKAPVQPPEMAKPSARPATPMSRPSTIRARCRWNLGVGTEGGRAGGWVGAGQVAQVGGWEVPWGRLHAQQQAWHSPPACVRDVARCKRRAGVARAPSTPTHQVGSRCFRLRAKRTPRGAKKPQPMMSSQMWACGAGNAREGQSAGETCVRQWCPGIMQLKMSPAQHCRGCWFRLE